MPRPGKSVSFDVRQSREKEPRVRRDLKAAGSGSAEEIATASVTWRKGTVTLLLYREEATFATVRGLVVHKTDLCQPLHLNPLQLCNFEYPSLK